MQFRHEESHSRPHAHHIIDHQAWCDRHVVEGKTNLKWASGYCQHSFCMLSECFFLLRGSSLDEKMRRKQSVGWNEKRRRIASVKVSLFPQGVVQRWPKNCDLYFNSKGNLPTASFMWTQMDQFLIRWVRWLQVCLSVVDVCVGVCVVCVYVNVQWIKVEVVINTNAKCEGQLQSSHAIKSKWRSHSHILSIFSFSYFSFFFSSRTLFIPCSWLPSPSPSFFSVMSVLIYSCHHQVTLVLVCERERKKEKQVKGEG